MLRVLTLSTLFPDTTRPNFGVFVERQTLGLAAHADVELKIVAPVGLPAWPLSRAARFAQLASLSRHEDWKGLETWRPRFTTIPGTGGRFHVAALVRALKPLLADIRRDFPFDLIDAEFFFPDGPAAIALGTYFGVPVSSTRPWSFSAHAAGSVFTERSSAGSRVWAWAMARAAPATSLPSPRRSATRRATRSAVNPTSAWSSAGLPCVT